MTEERLEYLTQKREMVLEKLKPLCEYFGIKYDYEISDGKQTDSLERKRFKQSLLGKQECNN